MALTSTSVIEVNQAALASDSNGGAFDSANAGSTGVDMTYGASAATIAVSASCTGTSTITFTSGTVTDAVLGNSINIGPYTTPPSSLTLSTATTGGTLAASTAYSYEVTCVTASGLETNVSSSASVTTGSGTATNTVTIGWGANPLAASYNIYGRTSSSYLKIANTTSTSYTDTGSITPAGSPPSANQTFIGIINSFVSSKQVTVNTSGGTPGTFTSAAAIIGGPYASVGYVAQQVPVVGLTLVVWWKGGNYSMSGVGNVSGGTWSFPDPQPTVRITGYYQSRGDVTETANLSNRPVIKATVASVTMFGNANSSTSLRGIILDGNSLSNVYGVQGQGQGNSDFLVYNCKFQNFAAPAIQGSYLNVDYCEATGCSSPPFQVNATRCYSHNNTSDGFYMFASWCTRCISAFNSGYGFNGRSVQISGCVAYKNAYGFNIGTGYIQANYNSIAYANTSYDITGAQFDQDISIGVAYGTSNATFANGVSSGIIPLTANPFVNPDGTIADISQVWAAFALNNTAGGGALCRGAGTPQYLDIGAVQSQNTGGGGVPRIVVPRRMW